MTRRERICRHNADERRLVSYCRGLREFIAEICESCLAELRQEQQSTPSLETAWSVTVLTLDESLR